MNGILGFTLEIPMELDPNPPAASEQREETLTLNGLRILLVEDNDLNLEIAQYLLAHAGASVDTAHNGKAAVKKFLEATQAIRSSWHPQAASVPIIAMTANAFSEDIRRSKEAGMNAHLAKPIDEKRLIHVILHFTRQKQ